MTKNTKPTDVKIEWVHASQGNLARLLPDALKRIGQFVDKYDLDANPDLLIMHIAHQAALPRPENVILVSIADGKVVGHLVAAVDNYFGSSFVVITQLEVDKGINIGRATFDKGLEYIDDWARNLGISKQRIWARNEAVSRIFTRYGYRSTGKVLMERDVPAKEEESPAELPEKAEEAVA